MPIRFTRMVGTDNDKARIVSEATMPGASMLDIAQHHRVRTWVRVGRGVHCTSDSWTSSRPLHSLPVHNSLSAESAPTASYHKLLRASGLFCHPRNTRDTARSSPLEETDRP